MGITRLLMLVGVSVPGAAQDRPAAVRALADPSRRFEAERELVRRGPTAVPTIVAAMRDAEDPTPFLSVLSAIRQNATAAAPDLLERLERSQVAERPALAMTLGDLAPYLGEDQRAELVEFAQGAIRDGDARARPGQPAFAYRKAAVRLLVRASVPDFTDIELRARLRDGMDRRFAASRACIREAVCDLLAARGPAASAFVSDVEFALRQHDHPAYVLKMRAMQGWASPEAHDRARSAAERALMAIAPTSGAALSAWCVRLVDVNPVTRIDALEVLSAADASCAPIVPKLRHNLQVASPTILSETLQLVARLGPIANSARPELEQLANGDDRVAAKLAGRALERIDR